MSTEIFYATGRRKTSSARVYLKKGKGDISVNDRKLDEYFGRKVAQMLVCLLYTSPSPRDRQKSRMPSSA